MILRAFFIFFCTLFAALPAGAALNLTQVRSVLIIMSPSPGRGNVAAAINNARQMRRHGFTGELQLFIPTSAFNFNAATVRTFLPTLQMPARAARADIAPQPIVLEPGTSPVIVSGGAMEDAPIRPLPDVILAQDGMHPQDHNLSGAIVLSPSLLESGEMHITTEETGLRQWQDAVGVRLSSGIGYGTYGDPVVETARKTLAAEGGAEALKNEITALLRADPQPHLQALAPAVAAHNRRCLGVVYGVGIDGLPLLSRYLSSLAGLADEYCPDDSGGLVLSASRLSQEELTKLQASVARMQHLMTPDDATPRRLRYIDLMRGEAMPESLDPGAITFVHVGGFPHEIYGRLMMYGGLPPVVAGDSATSGAIATGRPFILSYHYGNMTTGANLKFMMADEFGLDPMLADTLFPETTKSLEPLHFPSIASKRAVAAFRRLSEAYAQPLAVNLLLLAEHLLSLPPEERERVVNERAQRRMRDGHALDAEICASYLASEAS